MSIPRDPKEAVDKGVSLIVLAVCAYVAVKILLASP